MRVLIVGGLTDNKFLSKIEPLVKNNKISKVLLFRYNGNVYEKNKKVTTLSFPKTLTRRLYDLYHIASFFFFNFYYQIDFIVGVYLYPHGLYSMILGKLLKKPVVLILPGSDLEVLIKTKKCKRLFLQAAFIGLRGSNSVNRIKKEGFDSNKIFVLPNIFNIEQYTYNRVLENANKKYDIIYTGFLRKNKRLDIFIEVVAKLQKVIPNIKCAICGSGPEKTELKKNVHKLSLEKNVEFIEYKEPISTILSLAKIYMFTSVSEGLPMSIVEAMSCGLPVIVSNINDIPDIVEHGKNGFLIPVLNVDCFSKYCVNLLNDEKLRIEMGINARKTIEVLSKNSYSFDAVYAVWDKIVLKLKKLDTSKIF